MVSLVLLFLAPVLIGVLIYGTVLIFSHPKPKLSAPPTHLPRPKAVLIATTAFPATVSVPAPTVYATAPLFPPVFSKVPAAPADSPIFTSVASDEPPPRTKISAFSTAKPASESPNLPVTEVRMTAETVMTPPKPVDVPVATSIVRAPNGSPNPEDSRDKAGRKTGDDVEDDEEDDDDDEEQEDDGDDEEQENDDDDEKQEDDDVEEEKGSNAKVIKATEHDYDDDVYEDYEDYTDEKEEREGVTAQEEEEAHDGKTQDSDKNDDKDDDKDDNEKADEYDSMDNDSDNAADIKQEAARLLPSVIKHKRVHVGGGPGTALPPRHHNHRPSQSLPTGFVQDANDGTATTRPHSRLYYDSTYESDAASMAEAPKASIPYFNILEMGHSALVQEPTKIIRLPKPTGAIRNKNNMKSVAKNVQITLTTEEDRPGRQKSFESNYEPNPISELEQCIEQTSNQ
ncbi:hypothetical protein BG000_009855 [Podila horticola]|nr:hypothetical protein BG000_009855 [Podila horticola]